jgi:2,5-diketo-D-gluconate reductase A
MKTRTLTADVEIPYLGFGTYLIANGEVAAAVHEAIRTGYRHIDTAEGYQNESGVGAGVRQALESEDYAPYEREGSREEYSSHEAG